MGLFSKIFTVGGATLLSRVLGFAREMLIAFLLGAGPVADAFYAAFRFPNLFRRLFAEGAFNSAFVPMFSRELEKNGPQLAKKFAENILGFLVLALFVLTVLAEIFMPWLVGTIVAPRFIEDMDKFNLTVELTRIMFPFLFCMSLVAMLSGILNALRRYFIAAIATVIMNVVLVIVLLFAYSQGVQSAMVGRLMAWGILASGILQLALLYYWAAKQGYKLRLSFFKPSTKVKKFLVLAFPVALTGGITQINLLVGQIIASAQSGAIAILNYADRIYQLPLGVVGIAIGVVLLPELTRALAASEKEQAQHLQNRSLEFALLLTLPAAVGLYYLPGPIVAMLYERGAFSAQTTLLTAGALAAFAIGLPAFVLQKIFQPAYFARFNMRAPMWFALISALTNIVGSLLLFPTYGHVGIAISTSIAGWVNVTLLVAGLRGSGNFKLSRDTVVRLTKIILAAIIMALFLYAIGDNLDAKLVQAGFLWRTALVLMTIVAAAILYFGTLFLTGGLKLRELKSLGRKP